MDRKIEAYLMCGAHFPLEYSPYRYKQGSDNMVYGVRIITPNGKS